MNSPLLEKSMDFATQIVLLYEEFSKSKKDTTSLPSIPQNLRKKTNTISKSTGPSAFFRYNMYYHPKGTRK